MNQAAPAPAQDRTGSSLGSPFNRLWLSTGAANLADGMTIFLLPLMALRVGASAGETAAVTAALTASWPLFGLHAGWLVDRLPRARLFVSANLLRAGILALLTWLHAADRLEIWAIISSAAVLGVAETLIDTALTATVPAVVSTRDLNRANARIEATINGANQFVGPSLAGALAAVTLALVSGAGAVAYLVAAAALGLGAARRRLAGPATESSPESGVRAFSAGLRFVWQQPVVRSLTLFTAGMNVVWAAVTALLVVYAVAPGPLGMSTTAYGFLLTAMAVGGLLASFGADWLRRGFRMGDLLILDCIGTVCLSLPVALGAGRGLVVLGVVVAGAGSSLWRILVNTIRQRLTPPPLMGRVYSASRTISWGVIPVSAGLAGAGADLWGVRPVFTAISALAVGLLLAFVTFNLRVDLDQIVAANEEDPTAL